MAKKVKKEASANFGTGFGHLALVMDHLYQANITPNLIGPHGIGKTEFIRQYAKTRGFGLIEFRLGTCSDAGDLTGVPKIELKDGQHVTIFATPEFFPRNHEQDPYGGKWILFFDEWNRCVVKEVYQAIFNLILEKRMNQYAMPENSWINLACNPATDDYDVFSFEDAAFRDRLCHLKVTPTQHEFMSFIRNKHGESSIIDFLDAYGSMSSAKTEDFSLPEVKYSRRTWDRIIPIEKAGASEEVLTTIMQGMVGIHATQTYMKHREMNQVIRGKDILDNFPKVKPKIIEIGNAGKIDIINNLGDDVVRELNTISDSKKRLTPEQEENLTQFVMTVPKDFGLPFLKEKLKRCKVLFPKIVDGAFVDKEKSFVYDKRFLVHFDKYTNEAMGIKKA